MHGQVIDNLDAAGAFLAKQSGQPLRMYSTRDFGREKYPEARSVLVDPSRAMDLVKQMRSRLGPGLVAFVGTERSLASPSVEGTEVVVGKGSSQFDILRIAATDAINYGMATEDLVARLRQWDAAYGIDIYKASTDSIELRLKTLPPDLHAFAVQLYGFCPDIVDQGVGTVDRLEEYVRQTHTISLWWD
ncbi:MAG TPA: DUF4253 domain-containing protein [Dyella sp.]|nr:DUF4253 domain-containing protein [Dyella sp.]